MSNVENAKNRIAAVLEEIKRLKESEFAYTQPLSALRFIDDKLKHQRSVLDVTSPESDPDTVDNQCEKSLARLYEYVPILGFLLRSTNVRNAFECYGPLLHLAQCVLGDHIQLILSSEWQYSPYIWVHRIHLPGFVLIGLPAPESSNPLVLPLAGHELGHSVWFEKGYSNYFSWSIHDDVENKLKNEMDDIKKRGSYAQRWASKQIEEIFCDCFGLRLFAESYLQAFAYIITPGIEKRRTTEYPDIKHRASMLEIAAKKTGVSVPKDFVTGFRTQTDEWDPATRLLAKVADAVAASRLSDLINLANEYADAKDAPRRDACRVSNIYGEFRSLIIPTTSPQSLVDVLNAGWKCAADLELWDKFHHIKKESWSRILADLMLKSMEVAEIYEIQEA